MIPKAVLNNIPCANANGIQKPPDAPPIMTNTARFINWSWGLKDMREFICVQRTISAKRAIFRLGLNQIRFAQNGQPSQIINGLN